jgi:virginiamycin B lyase
MKAAFALGSALFVTAVWAQMPPGDGQHLVETQCTGCHELARVTSAGYSETEWRDKLAMMKNVGGKFTDEETIVAYLAKNFPEKPMAAAVLLPGPARVEIHEWATPTAGSRPHDPLLTRDGALWYTGQFANLLGRLDPRTGDIREFHLKTPQSGPHGLVEDSQGRIWFTANSKGYVGVLDPKTGDVKEYPMPDPEAKDPHTPIFDAKGRLWFTVQGGNDMGRIDPANGEVKLVKSLTPKSRPYGVKIDSKGVPFVVLFGTNKIARLDPDTMQIREYTLPEGARPRRLTITPDDAIWYSDYARGHLGRLDPRTGGVKEWASPGGPQSQPYGMTNLDGAIWYSESNVKPNTIVRFDPKTEKFQTWAVPSGGGVIRNVDVRGHDIGIACSGVNRVGIVKVRAPASVSMR